MEKEKSLKELIEEIEVKEKLGLIEKPSENEIPIFTSVLVSQV